MTNDLFSEMQELTRNEREGLDGMTFYQYVNGISNYTLMELVSQALENIERQRTPSAHGRRQENIR